MIIKYIRKMFCEIFVADKGQTSEKTIPTDLSCCKNSEVCYSKNKNQRENLILLTMCGKQRGIPVCFRKSNWVKLE